MSNRVFQEIRRFLVPLTAWIIVILSIGPLANPIGLPLGVGDSTQDAYDTVEAIPAGSQVAMIIPEYGAWSEMGGAYIAFFDQCLSKDLKILIIPYSADAMISIDRWLRIVLPRHPDKEYGVDYVDLGYIAGIEAWLAAAVDDLWTAKTTDRWGDVVADIPMMADLKTASDFELAWFGDTSKMGLMMIRHWYPLGMPIIGHYALTIAPVGEPYYRAGQFAGLLAGLRGGAEYEKLVGKPGPSTAMMDAGSLTGLVMMIWLILANIDQLLKYLKRE